MMNYIRTFLPVIAFLAHQLNYAHVAADDVYLRKVENQNINDADMEALRNYLMSQEGTNRRRLFDFSNLLYAMGVCHHEGDSWGLGHYHCPPDPLCHGPHPPKRCSYSNGGSSSNSGSSSNYNSGSSSSNRNGDSSSSNGSSSSSSSGNNYDSSANDAQSYYNNNNGGDSSGNYYDNSGSYYDNSGGGDAAAVKYWDEEVGDYVDATGGDGTGSSRAEDSTYHSGFSDNASAQYSYWKYIVAAVGTAGVVGGAFFHKRSGGEDGEEFLSGELDSVDHDLDGSVARRMGLLADGATVPPIHATGSKPTFIGVPPSRTMSSDLLSDAPTMLSAENMEGTMEAIELELQRGETLEAIEMEMKDPNGSVLAESPYVAV